MNNFMNNYGAQGDSIFANNPFTSIPTNKFPLEDLGFKDPSQLESFGIIPTAERKKKSVQQKSLDDESQAIIEQLMKSQMLDIVGGLDE